MLRNQFPQLGDDRIYLDNAAGTLMPQSVANAMGEAALHANPQPERNWPAARQTRERTRQLRQMLGTFLNAQPGQPIYLSESTTASFLKLRLALEPSWEPRHNLVVTDCDHFANITPWEWRARWQVRRARMLADGHLDLDHLASLLDESTRLLAVTMASNGLGTILRLQEAVGIVRQRAPHAFIVVDAVHAAPHLPIDVQAIGCDALGFSAYKLFGPFCGVLWMRDVPQSGYFVEPHTDAETLLEMGTLNQVTVAGLLAALDYVPPLADIVGYEATLSREMLNALRNLPHVRLFGSSGQDRVPTFAFTVDGVPDDQLEARLWQHRIQIAAGNHYSAAVTRGLGRKSVGRASFAHYNRLQDVHALAEALATLR